MAATQDQPSRGPVLLGYIHGGTVRAEFMAAVVSALAGPSKTPLIGGVCDASAGPLIAMARNLLMGRFLEGPLEWLWCVDTDIVFAPDALDRLLAAADRQKRPVVSALYFIHSPTGDQIPAAYTAGPDDNGELTFSHLTAWPDDDLVEVDGVGAGCVLIHRDVLTAIQANLDGMPLWWREMVVGHKEVGEDLSFCIRARAIDIPLYVHTGVQVGHVKTVTLGKVL